MTNQTETTEPEACAEAGVQVERVVGQRLPPGWSLTVQGNDTHSFLVLSTSAGSVAFDCEKKSVRAMVLDMLRCGIEAMPNEKLRGAP